MLVCLRRRCCCIGLQSSASFGEPNSAHAPVFRIWKTCDQAIALHPRERIGHCGLFDADQRYQITLRQPVALPKMKHHWEHTG